MNHVLIRPFILILCLLASAAVSTAADTVELFSSADAARLLGQPVIHSQMIGPAQDDDAPAQATHWTYRTREAAVVVTRMDFASAAEAQKFSNPDFIKKQIDESAAKITAETGVGEKAFWAVTEEGIALTFLKGTHIASIALGGKSGGSLEAYKSALKAAAIGIAAKL